MTRILTCAGLCVDLYVYIQVSLKYITHKIRFEKHKNWPEEEGWDLVTQARGTFTAAPIVSDFLTAY